MTSQSKPQCLIDADVLRYEVGAISQNQDGPLSFDYAADQLDERIEAIVRAAGGRDPLLFLTGSGNFRHTVAVTKPYKGNRKSEKPFHFKNITAYIKGKYPYVIAEGCEADDLMSIMQYSNVAEGTSHSTVICTRDKDLLMIPGLHYGWECGAQRERHKHLVTQDGRMYWEGKKLRAEGMTLFWVQMLTGDQVDNIPGCPGVGPVGAYKLLNELDVFDMWEVVYDTYKEKGCSDDLILEQGRLLWMTRETDDEGNPVLWNFPD